MKFLSTRNSAARYSAVQAILQGISPDGGLFVPETFPTLDYRALLPLSYAERAAKVLAAFIDDIPEENLLSMARTAYARFGAPLKDGILELYHGPTLAFKDMALQILPHLMRASCRAVGETREILILTATSGDTGKAALEGFAGQSGTRVIVFYPDGGVSEAQKLQMVTQEGDNVRVVAVEGNFDDAQTGVKRIFASDTVRERLNARGIVLSSANSINLGRLLPQIAYYFSAYADSVLQGVIAPGEPLNVCVPTGNFGNILAAAYARRMGLPLGKLICASNRNHILTDFIRTGVYDRRREFYTTSSPSMDILISSNLERMLFELAGRDDAHVREWMRALRENGVYALDGSALRTLQDEFFGGWASEGATEAAIAQTFREKGRVIDPHTAVAISVLADYRTQTGDGRPCVVVSTASPYKFGRAVYRALGGDVAALDDFACCEAIAALVGESVPQSILDLPHKPILHTAKCAPQDMERVVLHE
ncbi:MAG TPA: threonine synthase [Candidatus Alectryocaccomicrobium excrementavium]|uniref:Threonine synthase n=1 Tax=Candidatus Alectryocaccomicrobium excrementavium TaxID=2840668 RepID=A0A9D1G3X2_9FIRM|nr:threonine synthase [Candidatus Alectryocaccomicrobium excrementavium]